MPPADSPRIRAGFKFIPRLVYILRPLSGKASPTRNDSSNFSISAKIVKTIGRNVTAIKLIFTVSASAGMSSGRVSRETRFLKIFSAARMQWVSDASRFTRPSLAVSLWPRLCVRAKLTTLVRLVSPHQRSALCRHGEQHPYNSEYKQNLPMDNTRAFVIFQNPTYFPYPARSESRRQ